MKLFRYRATPIVFLFWVFFLWLLRGEVISQSFFAKDAYIDINDGALIMRQDYLGYYLGNQKIGFSQYILKEDSDESSTKSPEKYFLFESDSFLQIEALGIPMTLKTRQSGEVNEDLSLRSFTFSYEASGQRLTVVVTVEKDGLHIKTKSEGDTSGSVIPINGPVYQADMIHLVAAREGIQVGKQFIFPIFEAMTMSYCNATIKVLEETALPLPDGKTVDTFKIETDLKGFKSTSWIDKEGNVYKEVSNIVGINCTAVRETKEQATDMSFVSSEVNKESKPEVDLIKASRIEIDPPIENPKTVCRMTVKLIGADKSDIVIDGTFQKLQSESNKELILDIQQADYKKLEESQKNWQGNPPYPLQDPNLEPFWSESPLIQCNNPQIKEKAKEIVQSAENPWNASKMIATWLYRNIRKEMRVTIPSAVEVLSSMKGDCNEHSTLFTALARSIGIPTKICAGLVYQDDGFYYHAWNEVFIDGYWYPVDSTLNRIDMDAAHIKLAEGSLDSQSDIVKLIGNLKVEVLSIQHNE